MQKKSFEDITVVCVTGSTEYIQGSIYAIQRSCEALKGAKGLLISPALPAGTILPDSIEYREIAPFGYMEYNVFVLYQLDFYIETDYCLIVQEDGWVLNVDNWRDEFWDYDYIGAPVGNYCYHENGLFYALSVNHYVENLDLLETGKYIEPQNGGFSLRSKKLLGMPRQLGLQLNVTPPIPPSESKSVPYKMEYDPCIHNEDIFLTAYCRPILINNGIKFAPSRVAYKFAVESYVVHLLRQQSLFETFGGHFFGSARLVDYNKIQLNLPPQCVDMTDEEIGTSELVQLLAHYGYELQVVFHNVRPCYFDFNLLESN